MPVADASAGGGLSLAGSVISGWSAGAASLSLAASGVAFAEVSSCGSSLPVSSTAGAVSGVEVELTDIGGSSAGGGSLILDAGGVTDIEAAGPAVWLSRAASWSRGSEAWPQAET